MFFRLQVYERVGISLVGAYDRVGKSVIWVCERDTGLTDEFYSFIKTIHLQQFKGIQSSKQGIRKEYHWSVEGILKGYLFREKWYIKG